MKSKSPVIAGGPSIERPDINISATWRGKSGPRLCTSDTPPHRAITTKRTIPFALIPAILAAGLLLTGAGQEDKYRDPEFTNDNQLVRPKDYREWIYISSGLGMTYGPAARADSSSPMFDNVFVEPSAYRTFKRTGKWPDKTIFVLEVRSSASHGSINKGGSFQDALVSVEAEVKDESRFPEQWAYFSFSEKGALKEKAAAFPKQSCYSCHKANGAVENTFVQFYPTLLPIAINKGTLNAGYKPDAGRKP